jgi:carboxypeptidase Q
VFEARGMRNEPREGFSRIPYLLPRALAVVVTLITASASAQTDGERLVAHALNSRQSYDTLSYLTDNIGPRLSGSRGAELAVAWTTRQFRRWGIDVRNEKIMVPHWVRGAERARLVSHNDQNIVVTALGGSVATPPEGITADVIEVHAFDELKALGRERVQGKIVFFHSAMNMDQVRAGRAFDAYGDAVKFRSKGADEAAAYGAVASVIRSVASASLRTPHTGAMKYEATRKIPAAAMSAEDAMLVSRLLKKGDRVRMHLLLTPRTLPDVPSANVVAEIRGSERPDEIVVVGGHLDSWDLGTGAIDNGSGIAMVMETMRLIKELNLKPKRTIRAVLFMNEENGLRGGKGYAAAHAKEHHVAAIETDAGVGAPLRWHTTLKDEPLDRIVTRVKPLLDRIAPMTFETAEETGADTSELVKLGVPGFGFVPDPRLYFDYHHAPSDTLDKVNPDDLARDTAAVAAMTWAIADSTESVK